MNSIWCDCECAYVEAGYCIANCEREVDLQELLAEALVKMAETAHDHP